MLLRAHRSSIDVHVRIDFDGSDVQTGHFKQETSGGRCKRLIRRKTRLGACATRTDDTLADTTDDASRDENVLHFTIETRGDRQRQEQAATWEGANRKSASSLNTKLNAQPMPPRPPTVEDAFDDETDLPLPSRALPNTGARGALLEEVDSEDEMDIPTEPTQKPPSRSKPPESKPTISKQSPEFERMKR